MVFFLFAGLPGEPFISNTYEKNALAERRGFFVGATSGATFDIIWGLLDFR
jgi:hypothetical protein